MVQIYFVKVALFFSTVERTLKSLCVQHPWLHSMEWELCARCDLCMGEDEDPEGCSLHRARLCPHPDCSHFIPLVSKPLMCDRTYRSSSCLLSEEKLKPWVKVWELLTIQLTNNQD